MNSYTGEALDEYKVFFISDIGKLFSSKTELASYLSSEKGLTIGEWLTEESYTFSTIVDGEIISGCGVDTE